MARGEIAAPVDEFVKRGAGAIAIAIQDRNVEGEQRYQLIGAVYSRVILVAHAIAETGEEEAVIQLKSRHDSWPLSTQSAMRISTSAIFPNRAAGWGGYAKRCTVP